MLSTDHTTSLPAYRHPFYAVSGCSYYGMNGYMAPPPHMEHIWIITGPAGCGKTTVAQYLAQELSLPYVEGDDVWPPAPGDGASD